MQYLNTMLWDTLPDTTPYHFPDNRAKSPEIDVIDEKWQRNKCNILGLTFDSVSRQPSNIVGRPLSGYEPYETEDIKRDGNCLFRCLSKIITGSQNSHLQLRSLIARFIASEGTSKLGWCFRSKRTTPCEYFLTENLVHIEGTWASDVEIMAASAILDADIYVANSEYRSQGSLIREVRWSLHRASTNPTATLYITNYVNHYEPVISMLNSPTPTYGIVPDEALLVE